MPSRFVAALVLAASALLASPGATGAPAGGEAPVRLVPHRAVYDLSLSSSQGARNLEGARGRIAFEFTGNACEGYALRFRQVTVLESAEAGTKISDLRSANFEGPDGRSFRFRNDNTTSGQPRTTIDGTAERRRDGKLSVRLKGAARPSLLDGSAVFPNAQMRDIIQAAREGRHALAMKLFDGSDDGRKVYDTLAVIGAPVQSANLDILEEPARQDALARMPRWPVSISYFAPGRGDLMPSYVLSFELYDNGVSRALKLDYGDFVLKGEMTRLELLPDTGCQR